MRRIILISTIGFLLAFSGCMASNRSEIRNSDANSALTVVKTEFCGEGPALEVNQGALTIKVRPLNDADGDFANLQRAANEAVSGGTIELCDGTFFLGDGVTAEKKTVVIRKGLNVIGKKGPDEWKTIIRGGGAVVSVRDVAPESGPFRIENYSDSKPNRFQNLWFREWTAEVIFIKASNGFIFKDNKISHPLSGKPSRRGVVFVHAIWGYGPSARGDFTAENNQVELTGYDRNKPHDEQFLGIFFSAFSNIRIVGNTIIGHDEGIEILGNKAPQSSEIVVEKNRMDLVHQRNNRWPSIYPILIAGNRSTRQVRIEDNSVTSQGWSTAALGLSGENLTVARNRIVLKRSNNGLQARSAMQIGLPDRSRFMGLDLGVSLINSVIKDNEFSGSISGPAVYFLNTSETEPNISHNNLFQLGESISSLGGRPTLILTKKVYGNTFEGRIDGVRDASPQGANSY